MQHSTQYTCANGLQLLVRPQPGSAVVSVQVWVETGSALEGAYAGSGISHLLEHMVFKGTQEYSAADLNEKVAALGGLWNAYTSTDRTVFHIDGPAAHWQSFLHILLQLTLHPSFPADEWEREREVIRREMAMYRDDPNDAAYRALIETLFTRHPRRLPVIGEQAAFDALTPEDMRRYHAERYVPGNMFICIVGDVAADAAAAAVEAEMLHIPPCAVQSPSVPEEPRQWGPRLFRREFSQPTSTLMLAWRVPHINHPDSAALALLSSILGEGRSAWLYTRFHDEQAQVHDIATMLLPQSAGEGALVVEADVDRDRRDALRDALLEYVAALPQADFEGARRRVLRRQQVRHLRAISTVHGLADLLGSFWHHSRNTHAYEEWRAALEAVTPADLQRVATTWLTPQRLVEVSVDPTGSNASAQADAADQGTHPLHAHTLANGLRCVVRPDHRRPLFYATLAVQAGCRVESAAQAGLSSLLAECLPKGTTTRSAAQIAASVEDYGGSLNCRAGNNTLLLTLRCLAEDAPTMLELLADVALHPDFPAEAVNTAREDMLADILEEQEDPVALAFRKLRGLCFGAVSYGNSPAGTAESVAALTRDDLVAMHRRLMCGCNAVLSLAGDVDAETIIPCVDKLFGAMPAGAPVVAVSTPPQQPADAALPTPEGKEQAVLALAMPALPLSDPDQPLLLLFDEWCQDMAGPIFAEIREKRGLAYHAASSLLLGVDAGCIFFSLETAPAMLAEARAALEEVLARLAVEGMSPEALERARATAVAARLLAAQSTGKECSAAAVDTLLGLGADYPERSLEAIKCASHEQMQAFIRRLLSPTAVRTWVSMQP